MQPRPTWQPVAVHARHGKLHWIPLPFGSTYLRAILEESHFLTLSIKQIVCTHYVCSAKRLLLSKTLINYNICTLYQECLSTQKRPLTMECLSFIIEI